MYKGVIPFIGIQIAMLVIAYLWPDLITWLPEQVYGN
jgi:TRAP-type mannitol/chloroaromatic compound transport system permease large subunit